jgi:hypothetical protein
MKIEYINVNTNKLHDELIANGITPILVESLEDKTWITFEDGVDMGLVQQIINAHDPTPTPTEPTTEERLKLAEDTILFMLMGGM